MFLVGILKWWYGDGWRQRIIILRERLEGSTDFFSIRQLAKTLFSPYKQISAGRVEGSLDIMVRAFADRTISRFIGAAVRSLLLLFGFIAMSVQIFFGVLMMATWLIIPFLPVVGLILFVIGWVPRG